MIKFTQEIIGYMRVFASVTHVQPKDAFLDNHQTLVVIVDEGDAGRAIGKRGANIQHLSQALRRRVRVIEFHDDIIAFIRSIIAPLTVEQITREGDLVTLQPKDSRLKGLLIGRDHQNLDELNMVVQRYFPVAVKVT